MPTRETKLFPTPDNYWQNGHAPNPFPVAALIRWLQAQMDRVPEGDRETLVAGNVGSIELTYLRQMSQQDVDRERLSLLFDQLSAATMSGLTPKQIEGLLKAYHALG